jgi:diguanylate cyclase (GGDEF)-like protein
MLGHLRQLDPIHRYVVTIMVSGAAVLCVLATAEGSSLVSRPDLAFWVLAFLVVLGEWLLISVHGHDGEIAVSTSFSFAVLLMSGPVAAIVVQTLATVCAETSRRRPLDKTAFTAAQFTIALGGAWAVLMALSGIPHADAPPHFVPGDVPAIFIAGAVFFTVNNVLAGTASALASGRPVIRFLLHDIGFHGSIAAMLLGLAPIVVIVAEVNVGLVPLLLVPLYAVHQGRRQASMSEHHATHDRLTGLPNRALFRDRVEQAILAAERDGRTVGVMLMDLDRFKEINDTLGHHHGDLLLQKIGPRLREVLRESDSVARLGGDEFAVVLRNVASRDALVRVAENMLEALSRPVVLDGVTLDIAASIGIVRAPEHGTDVDTLIKRADVAMYRAKEAHSGFEIYASEFDGHSHERLALVGELRRSVERNELVLHYQPVVELSTGHVSGVEALVRWQHPERGLLGPGQFIPVAEHTGLIRPITMYVLSAALRQVNEWREGGLDLSVAVNVSARTLLDRQLPSDISRLLAETRVDASRLELEITESIIISDPFRAMAILRELSAMGVRLAIDDFGTGYSSLAYLKRLPVGKIKLDRSFVSDMSASPHDAVIVKSTIDLGRSLGLKIVAEGVEDRDTLHDLAELGCDLVQGYLFSRPLPADDAHHWIVERERAVAAAAAARAQAQLPAVTGVADAAAPA